MIRRPAVSILAILAAAACSAATLAADDAPPVRPMSGMADEATFTYYRSGQYLGTSYFRWDDRGEFDGSSVMGTEEGSVSTSTRIEVDDAGLWTRITVQQADRTFVIERKADGAELHVGDETKSIRLVPGSVIIEDMSPALMRLAIAGYDEEQGGRQPVPVLFAPVKMVHGTLELVESFQAEISGESRAFRRFRFLLPPVYGLDVVVDRDDRVCTVRYPVQDGTFVRMGYEALAPSLIRDTEGETAGSESAKPAEEPPAQVEEPR
jgi:hypothetical protein